MDLLVDLLGEFLGSGPRVCLTVELDGWEAERALIRYSLYRRSRLL